MQCGPNKIAKPETTANVHPMKVWCSNHCATPVRPTYHQVTYVVDRLPPDVNAVDLNDLITLVQEATLLRHAALHYTPHNHRVTLIAHSRTLQIFTKPIEHPILTHFILMLVQTSCSQFLIISSNQSVSIKK